MPGQETQQTAEPSVEQLEQILRDKRRRLAEMLEARQGVGQQQFRPGIGHRLRQRMVGVSGKHTAPTRPSQVPVPSLAPVLSSKDISGKKHEKLTFTTEKVFGEVEEFDNWDDNDEEVKSIHDSDDEDRNEEESRSMYDSGEELVMDDDELARIKRLDRFEKEEITETNNDKEHNEEFRESVCNFSADPSSASDTDQ